MHFKETYRVDKSSNGLENQPLRINLQSVLMGSLDAVKNWLLVTVHGGILQNKEQIHDKVARDIHENAYEYLFSTVPHKSRMK